MYCPCGRITGGKVVFQTGGRLVRLLNAHAYRASNHRALASFHCQHTSQTHRNCRLLHTSPRPGDRRPNRWACRLSTSCQAAASSPHAAVIEKAESKASKQTGQLVPLPTTDESPALDRIRHSVSSDLPVKSQLWQCTVAALPTYALYTKLCIPPHCKAQRPRYAWYHGPTSTLQGSACQAVLQCSHVMAMAVQKLYPGAQVTIGPAIERGFYYDFDMPQPITEKDLKAVKKEMQRIIKADLPFTREEVCSGPDNSLASEPSCSPQ